MGGHRFQMGGQGTTAPPLATTLHQRLADPLLQSGVVTHNNRV